MRNPLSRVFRGRKSANLTPDGLPITEFPAPVVQLLRLYGAMGGTYAQLYASQPNVRTVIDDLAREAAELSLKMYLKDPRGGELPDARLEVDHPMMDLLSDPMPGLALYRFWFSLFADIAIYDRALWWKLNRKGAGPPQQLMRIPPANLLPIPDPITGEVHKWRNQNGQEISTNNLVVFWGYDPQVNHGSIAPMETLRRILSEEFATNADREGRWNNSLRKDGVIEQASDAPPMSDEARESFLLDVEDSLSGADKTAHPLLLQPGMNWKDIQWSPKDMEYIQGRKLNRTEVAAAFHYPAAKVLAAENGADPDASTLNYFYTSTLPPYLSRVESEIEAQLLPEFELSAKTRKTFYLEFNLDAKMRGSFETQAAVMATTAGGPVVTVNEARARLNLPPIEDGDKIFIPMNSMRAGGPQAGPQSPVDTPADGVNPPGTTPTPAPSQAPTPPGQVSRAAPGDVGPFLVMGGELKELLSPNAGDETIEAILSKHDARTARTKAMSDHVAFLREVRARYEGRFSKMLGKFFTRQRNAATGGKPVATARWDKELADDLFGVFLQIIEVVGGDAAKRLSGDWSTERTVDYLRKHTAMTAKSINAATAEQLKADGADVEVIFGEGRITELSTSLTTHSTSWGVGEAVHQNDAEDAVHKTWHTTSGNPRATHAALDGTTIPFAEAFDNGLKAPGDGSTGNIEELANCACVLTIGSPDRASG